MTALILIIAFIILGALTIVAAETSWPKPSDDEDDDRLYGGGW